MSGGIEVLAGIGILCNAMQIVTFGKDALEVYSHIRESGTTDPRLTAYLIHASKSYEEMQNRLSKPGPLTSDQQEIVNIGEEAHQCLQRFRTYFGDLYIDPASRKGFRGKLRVTKSGVKALVHSRDLEDLETNFERYQRLFQTRLIQRACSQKDAAALLIHESFNGLETTQKSIIKKIAEGYTDLSVLVSQKTSEVKDHVTDQHEETRSAIGNHLSVTEGKLFSHITQSTSAIQQDLGSQKGIKDEIKRYDQLLASLRYPEMDSRRNQVIHSFPKTFQWIFSNEISRDESTLHNLEHYNASWTQTQKKGSIDFIRWLGSGSKMFWISGKPGSGKSTLMKFIATNPCTQEHITGWRSGVRILSHYFWKGGTSMERSLEGLLLSLTYQTLQDNFTLAQQLWQDMPDVRHKWFPRDWDQQQLENALFWAFEASGESFLLLIDGLDESEELGANLYMTARNQSLLKRLAKLPDVKICVSSREEYIFSRHFEGVGRLRIHELTKHDIREYAGSRLENMDFAHSDDRERIFDLYLNQLMESSFGLPLFSIVSFGRFV